MPSTTTTDRNEGILADWNGDRGFGFIQPTDGGRQVFVHIRAFPRGTNVPVVGERLSYEVELNQEGKTRARYVRVVGDKAVPTYGARSKQSVVSYLAIVAFAVLYLIVQMLWHPSLWILETYIGTSVTCFVIYALDKSAALAGKWRVSESALLLLGLAGGWPGAIIAQQILRHKTKKRSFQAAFAGSIVVNVLLFVLLISPAWTGLVATF
jgi:uncharacterized membrane protein YsdA (DUF1294 family)/cold shock CspA family protein